MPPLVIDDSTPNDVLFPKSHPCGTISRDFTVQPADFFGTPAQVKVLDIVDRWDWSGIDAWIAEKKAKKARIRDVADANNFQVLDQNGQGFCWAYDEAQAVMVRHMLSGRGVPRLSAHAVACKIKNFRDEGGWAALAHAFFRKEGCPDVMHWKEKSMSREYDTPAAWENAKQYIVTEDVVDLNAQVWDQTMSEKIWWTLLLTGNPVDMDWQFWGHSVLGCDIERLESGVYTVNGPNSWGMGWGDRGWYSINLKAHPRPMGCVATIGVAA